MNCTCFWSVCVEGAKLNAYTMTYTFKLITMPKVIRFTMDSTADFERWKEALKPIVETIREMARGASSMDTVRLEEMHQHVGLPEGDTKDKHEGYEKRKPPSCTNSNSIPPSPLQIHVRQEAMDSPHSHPRRVRTLCTVAVG